MLQMDILRRRANWNTIEMYISIPDTYFTEITKSYVSRFPMLPDIDFQVA